MTKLRLFDEIKYKFGRYNSQMHIPVSDADFFQRKAIRLEKDIANLNQQLNIARARLRSAEDFQIKYQLLLRQSQQQNLRVRKIQQAERAQIAQLIAQQIQKTNQQWLIRLNQSQEDIRAQQREQRQKLTTQIADLQKKIKQMSQKSEQMDVLLFKNKKIAKDLEALEDIIEENRISNQRQRQEDIRQCKQNVTKKLMQKFNNEKQEYETTINKLKDKYEKLQLELMKVQMDAKQKPRSSAVQHPSLLVESKIKQELEKMINNLAEKDNLISELQASKIQQEQRHQIQIKQLKGYHRELQEQIFSIQTNHEVEILNFKIRMEQARNQELKQKQQQYQIIQKQHLKDRQIDSEKALKQKAELEHIRKLQEAQIAKLKDDKVKLLKKIDQLKERLRQFQANQEIGETQNMLNSLKNLDKKEDQASGYEEGVTFLERQLRKAVIKLQKKNAEVKQLVTKMSHLNEQFERQLEQARQKYVTDIRQKDQKIEQLQEDLKQLNELLRKKERENRDQEAEFAKKMNQINVQNRSLINMNNDLQRDYNRILESKKVIEKSFREERQRSMTSKSQIALAKKNKWLELQRQKNQIQIIYKEKEQQMKTNFEITITELRTQNDKFKRQRDLFEHELLTLKEKIKSNQPIEDKENAYSQFHKKLATVNLQIALTQNLYNSLLKAKSRVKKPTQVERADQEEPQVRKQRQIVPEKKKEKQVPNSKMTQFQANLNKVEEKGYKSFERSIKQIEKISQNSSREVKDSRDLKQFNKSQNEHPLYFDSDQEGGMSPTFNMFQSFNPHK